MSRAARAILLLLALGGCKDSVEPLDLAGPPASLSVTAGDQQRGVTGAPLPSALSVTVTDSAGRAAPGVVVTWSVTGGTLSQSSDTTDNAGLSSVVWTLPATPGTYSGRALAEGAGDVLFTAIAQPIAGTIVFRYLDAGSYHACGITTTEQLLCWGYGADGQLGIGTTTPQAFPQNVPGDLRYRLVTGGRYHSCGVTLAGLGSCWGSDADGRLGDGPPAATSSLVPVAVMTPPPSIQPTLQGLQAGRVHSCGLDLSQRAWCWGSGGEGELGNGTTSAGGHSVYADTVHTETPLKVLTLGGLHTCAVSVAGDGLCWGYNASGQLGDGTTTTRGLPVAVAGGLTFRTDPAVIFPSPDPDFPLPPGPFLAAGYDHTCGITSGGATVCWGLNQDGQLGDGTRTARTTPTTVGGSHAFAAVTAGLRHTCALDTAGAAFCWGDNRLGQLGDGTTTAHDVPTAASGGLVFAYLKAGELSTCGVTSEGVAYCWGDNEYGQLGDGTTNGSSVPVKVAFQP
jgi:alpha-tubulin suppressor-like RCC1 family protein